MSSTAPRFLLRYSPSFEQPAKDEAETAGGLQGRHALLHRPILDDGAHRLLAGIMRARRLAYEPSARVRGSRNKCPIHEPRGLENLPA